MVSRTHPSSLSRRPSKDRVFAYLSNSTHRKDYEDDGLILALDETKRVVSSRRRRSAGGRRRQPDQDLATVMEDGATFREFKADLRRQHARTSAETMAILQKHLDKASKKAHLKGEEESNVYKAENVMTIVRSRQHEDAKEDQDRRKLFMSIAQGPSRAQIMKSVKDLQKGFNSVAA